MRNIILLALAVVAVGVSVSEACSCMPTHPQTSYCNAEYGKEVVVYSIYSYSFLEKYFE